MPRNEPFLRRLTTAPRWPVGVTLTSWRYMWRTTPLYRSEERGNAERRALFVGLWPPMFWLIGDTLQRDEERSRATLSPRRLMGRSPGKGSPWNVTRR